MIIRLKKLHFLFAVLIVLCVSFFLALRAEKPVRWVSAGNNERFLPIVMYHHVTEKPKRAGKYVIKAQELRSDLEYIEKKGYTTVCVQDLLDFTSGKRSFRKRLLC